MKKIFVLTGEPSGDKLASQVINNLKKLNPNIDYLSVGGENLKSLGIKSIYDLKEITYLGFTNVILNLFKINKKINQTVKAIENFNPDILFTVDSPDFTLRVAEKIKKINPKIKTIHYVAPQVWVWREGRVKKIKKFLDHVLLLFNFEKKYFEKEHVSCEFVGHPLLEQKEKIEIDTNQVKDQGKKLISIFPGSRKSEIIVLMPILLDFIKLMNKKYKNIFFYFHSTKEKSQFVHSIVKESNLSNCEVVSDDKIKSYILQESFFAVSKSGTVSLEVCNARIPSIIIYKISYINFIIVKLLVKTKYANIINFAANQEIIPELLQYKCNPKNIFKHVDYFLQNPNKIKIQINKIQKILKELKINKSSSELASLSLNKFL
jgi:lipid-A-disaccharide synthase|tara:strand:- start:184 stop:1314 length:1131 start_codon:yes stop_codon:yes gene_type:complete